MFENYTRNSQAGGGAAAQAIETDKRFLLTYPNLKNFDGDVVLENEHVVLQRLVVGPGEWEGIYSHPGNQVFIHIKGGVWADRMGGKITRHGIVREDGAVGWMDAIDISEEHDSGNVGDTTIDLIWITLKQGECPLLEK